MGTMTIGIKLQVGLCVLSALCIVGYRVCSEGQIRCRSGQCIGEAQFCAGLISCADNSVYIDDNVCRLYFSPSRVNFPRDIGLLTCFHHFLH